MSPTRRSLIALAAAVLVTVALLAWRHEEPSEAPAVLEAQVANPRALPESDDVVAALQEEAADAPVSLAPRALFDDDPFTTPGPPVESSHGFLVLTTGDLPENGGARRGGFSLVGDASDDEAIWPAELSAGPHVTVSAFDAPTGAGPAPDEFAREPHRAPPRMGPRHRGGGGAGPGSGPASTAGSGGPHGGGCSRGGGR